MMAQDFPSTFSVCQVLPLSRDFSPLRSFFFFNLEILISHYGFIEMQFIYNVVVVSHVQQKNSDTCTHTNTQTYIYIHMCIYVYSFSDSLPYRLLQNFEYSSRCYTVGPC